MKAANLLAAAMAAALLATPAWATMSRGIAPDHGRFRILLRGQTVGTEDFTIARQGQGWEARSEIQLHLPGHVAETDSANCVLTADGSPIHYHWSGQSRRDRSIDVLFRGHSARITLRQPGSAPAIEAFSFPPGPVVLLDNNVYAQYAILARLYDWQTGGKQKFSVLIPQDQTPGTITAQSMGKRSAAGKRLDLLVVKSPDLEVDLYVDSAGRLMLLKVPGSGAEVIRE